MLSMVPPASRSVSTKLRHAPPRAKSKSRVFDVKRFLDSTGLGRRVGKFAKKETIFAQGDPAKHVMYIQEGGMKLSVVNQTGREAVVAILGPGDFLAKDVSEARPAAWPQPLPSHPPPCWSSKRTK